MAANTMKGLIACLNWITRAMKIMPTEISITIASSPNLSTCFSYSPPISSVYPGGSERPYSSMRALSGIRTSEESRPSVGKADTVMVRNWLRRCSFSVARP